MANLTNALVDMGTADFVSMVSNDVHTMKNFKVWIEDAYNRYNTNVNGPLMTALALTSAQQAQISSFIAMIGNLQSFMTGGTGISGTNMAQLLATILPAG
jgi:hypothetical protein